MARKILLLAFILLFIISSAFIHMPLPSGDMISYTIDPAKQDLQFYWKDDSGHIFGSGNFYLKPNGVLDITTANKAWICPTDSFRNEGQVKFATQSGPMLLIGGDLHPAFKDFGVIIGVTVKE